MIRKAMMTWIAVSIPFALMSSWDSQEPDAKLQATDKAAAPIEFPTLEPFREARMFRTFADKVEKLDLETQLAQLEKMAEIQREAREAAEQYGDGKPAPKHTGALLLPEVDEALRARFSLLPVAMMQLEPLWKVEHWTPEHMTRAASPLGYVAGIPGTPKIVLEEGNDAINHAQLGKLAQWFGVQVAKPELYAAMFVTMDDGPFSGLTCEKSNAIEARSMAVLDEKNALELRLGKDESLPEPWILQVVKAGKPLWTRVLSGSPRGSITEAELAKSTQHWPNYGWKAFIKIKWTYGSEMAYLYLNPKAEMCFYFLTW